MQFNPLFFSSAGFTETPGIQKNFKLNTSSYLFSDIIKVIPGTDVLNKLPGSITALPQNNLQADAASQNIFSFDLEEAGSISPGKSNSLINELLNKIHSYLKQSSNQVPDAFTGSEFLTAGEIKFLLAEVIKHTKSENQFKGSSVQGSSKDEKEKIDQEVNILFSQILNSLNTNNSVKINIKSGAENLNFKILKAQAPGRQINYQDIYTENYISSDPDMTIAGQSNQNLTKTETGEIQNQNDPNLTESGKNISESAHFLGPLNGKVPNQNSVANDLFRLVKINHDSNGADLVTMKVDSPNKFDPDISVSEKVFASNNSNKIFSSHNFPSAIPGNDNSEAKSDSKILNPKNNENNVKNSVINVKSPLHVENSLHVNNEVKAINLNNLSESWNIKELIQNEKVEVLIDQTKIEIKNSQSLPGNQPAKLADSRNLKQVLSNNNPGIEKENSDKYEASYYNDTKNISEDKNLQRPVDIKNNNLTNQENKRSDPRINIKAANENSFQLNQVDSDPDRNKSSLIDETAAAKNKVANETAEAASGSGLNESKVINKENNIINQANNKPQDSSLKETVADGKEMSGRSKDQNNFEQNRGDELFSSLLNKNNNIQNPASSKQDIKNLFLPSNIDDRIKQVNASQLISEIANFSRTDRSSDDQKNIVLKLVPESLGKVKISLDVSNNVVHARVEVENESAKALIQNNADNLKQSLSQQGLQLNSLNVSLSQQDNKSSKSYFTKRKSSYKLQLKEVEKGENKSVSKNYGYNTYEFLA